MSRTEPGLQAVFCEAFHLMVPDQRGHPAPGPGKPPGDLLFKRCQQRLPLHLGHSLRRLQTHCGHIQFRHIISVTKPVPGDQFPFTVLHGPQVAGRAAHRARRF